MVSYCKYLPINQRGIPNLAGRKGVFLFDIELIDNKKLSCKNVISLNNFITYNGNY